MRRPVAIGAVTRTIRGLEDWLTSAAGRAPTIRPRGGRRRCHLRGARRARRERPAAGRGGRRGGAARPRVPSARRRLRRAAARGAAPGRGVRAGRPGRPARAAAAGEAEADAALRADLRRPTPSTPSSTPPAPPASPRRSSSPTPTTPPAPPPRRTRSASSPPTAGSARFRSTTWAASACWSAARSTARPPCSTSASTPSASRRTLEAGEVTLASLVPTMLVRLRDAGPARAPRPAGDRARRRSDPRRAARVGGRGGHPRHARLRHDRDLLAGGRRQPRPPARRGRARGSAPTARSSSAARWWRPASCRPTAGSTPATSAASTGDGRLHVEGRLKELIVTGGENVAPLEVEQVLLAHPAVADAGGGRPARPGVGRGDRRPSWCCASRHRPGRAPRLVPRAPCSRTRCPSTIEFAEALPRAARRASSLQRSRYVESAPHDLRQGRRSLQARREDRGHPRLRLPGPRPRAQPEGLGRRRGGRAARGLLVGRQGQAATACAWSRSPTPPARATS